MLARRLVQALAACLLSGTVAAQNAGWRSVDGAPLETTEARKFVDGFGAWLIASSAAVTGQTSNTARGSLASAQSNEVRSVKRGTTLLPLVFLLNPARDAAGDADVRCGLRFRRPDGSEEKSYALLCLHGPNEGGVDNLRQAQVAVEFFADDDDPAGLWTIEAVVNDRIGKVTLTLSTTFELEDTT